MRNIYGQKSVTGYTRMALTVSGTYVEDFAESCMSYITGYIKDGSQFLEFKKTCPNRYKYLKRLLK